MTPQVGRVGQEIKPQGNSAIGLKAGEVSSANKKPELAQTAFDCRRHSHLYTLLAKSVEVFNRLQGLKRHVTRTSTPAAELVETFTRPDPELRRELLDTKQISLTAHKKSLKEELLKMLFQNGPFYEKAFYAKSLYLLNSDCFINDYLIPLLCKEEQNENYPGNFSFCLELLNAFNSESLGNILQKIDYSNLKLPLDFARSITRLKDQKTVFDILYFVLDEAVATDSNFELSCGDEVLKKKINNIVEILVRVLKRMEKEKKQADPKQLRFLFSIAVSSGHMKYLAEQLIKSKKELFRFLEGKLFDDSHTNDEARLRRFYSLSCLVSAFGGNSLKTLEDIIRCDADPYTVSHAVMNLLRFDQGKKSVVGVIKAKIQNGEVPIALGSVILLLKIKDGAEKVLKEILSLKFNDGDLVRSFKKLEGIEFMQIENSKRKDKTVWFHLKPCEGPILVCMLQRLGNRFTSWWGKGEDTGRECIALMNNARDIANYAISKGYDNSLELPMRDLKEIERRL